MSVITPLIIVVIAALIQAFLQLTPGTFSLFYHYALGKNSTKVADDFSLSFILGVEVFLTTIWLIIYSLIFFIFCNQPSFCSEVFLWITAGIFVAEAFAFFFFYFRKGRSSSALFIPRQIARNINARAEKIKTRSDAFTLGFATGSLELIFTLPLYIISIVELMRISAFPRIIAIIFYIIIATLPLFSIRNLYRTGHNLAEITRSRIRAKTFLRLSISLGFLLLAFIIITSGAFHHG